MKGHIVFWPGLERMLELPKDREMRPPVTLEEIDLWTTRLGDRRLMRQSLGALMRANGQGI